APSVTAGYYTSPSVAVAINGGYDSGSGLSGTTQLQRDVATLSGGSCTGWSGTWTNVTLSGGSDTGVTNGHCYQYREQLTDNVGNVGSSAASNIAKVDNQAPVGSPHVSTVVAWADRSGTTVYYNSSAAAS